MFTNIKTSSLVNNLETEMLFDQLTPLKFCSLSFCVSYFFVSSYVYVGEDFPLVVRYLDCVINR